MKTRKFFEILEKNTELQLVFQYRFDKYVGANYHITEVKHVSIDSVDCGGRTDDWKETIIQLWESPSDIGKTEYMSVYKALAILKKVGRIGKFDLDSELKIEYSNEHFNTAQLFIEDFECLDKKLIIKLNLQPTKCKAQDVCGVPEKQEYLMASKEPCCSTDGNCC